MKSPRFLHRLVLLPFGGVIWVAVALNRSDDPVERGELKAALLLQAAASGVLVVHLLLQVGIEAVRWLFARTEEMGLGMDGSLVPKLLLLMTLLNIGAGLVEWGVAVFVGLQAAGGTPYPGKKRKP